MALCLFCDIFAISITWCMDRT